MNIQTFFTLYLISVPVFFVIEIFWLAVVAKPFYQKELAGFLGPVNWPAAIVFYLLFALGCTVFALMPAASAGFSWKVAAGYGALFGFFTYVTYDLTNLATLKDWPLSVTIVDIIWGTIFVSLVATITMCIFNFFN